MKNLIQAAVVTLFAASAAQAQQPVQWRVQDGGNGHWYQLRDVGSLSWNAHRDACTEIGGHLATISSGAENAKVKSLIPLNAPFLFGPSIGFAQGPGASEPSGGWAWVTGEPVTYTDWHPGEPNNRGPGEHWVRMRFTDSFVAWNDTPETVAPGDLLATTALVEWDADCNGDGIVDYGQCRDGSLSDQNGNNVPDCCESGAGCPNSSRYAIFSRPTDTVRIGSNTSFAGDYTIEWSGFLLHQPVATNPPATWNARIWSEQDSVTEDKMVALNPDRTPAGWVNTSCYSAISGPSPLLVGQRTHVAMVRAGSTRRLFVDGMVVTTSSEPCTPFNGSGSNMALGAFVYVAQSPSNYWRAAPVALDWIRVSNSARYQGSFTPPIQAAIAVDAQTQLLMNFEGADPWRDLANPSAVITPGVGVAGGTAPTVSADCNMNGVPDQAELSVPGADQNGNGVLDVCESPTCYDADFFRDRFVNGADLGILLVQWGPNGQYTVSDLNHDGIVDANDLGLFLSLWGPCPY